MNEALSSACRSVCISPRQVPVDGKWHQTDADGKHPGNGNGRIKLFIDGAGGHVWNHISETNSIFWYDRRVKLTHSELEERRQRGEQEKRKSDKERVESQAKAAELAMIVWNFADPAKADNPYLHRKLVAPTSTLREMTLATLTKKICYLPKAKGMQFTGERILIVPVMGEQGLTTIEMIDETGRKAGLAGGRKKSCFWSNCNLPDGDGEGLTFGIGEGVATVLSFSMATGFVGIAALSCGNMKAVADHCHRKYPKGKIIIISDIGNGEQSAIEAAYSTGSLLVTPSFPEGSSGTDINDVHVEAGLTEVQRQINNAAIPSTILVKGDVLEGAIQPQSSEAWPEPLPLPEGLLPVKPLVTEMIPAPLRGWLMDIADRMQIPPDFSTAAAVVALGSIIGRACGIYPKRHDDWLVISNLWGGGVGRPSLLKTPAMTEAQRPVVRLETEARTEYQNAAYAQSIDSEIEKITRAAICEEVKRSIKKGDVEKVEQARSKLAGMDSEAPATRRRYQTQDGTTEKIGELLIENPRGLLINRDELIGWLRSLDKSGREGDRAFYLEAWNGTGGYTYDRIGRGTLDIEALCISVFGAITPGPLSEYVYQASRGGNGDDGLLQRFQVMVWPDMPNEWRNVDRFPDTTEKNRVWEIFRILAGNIPGAIKEDGANIPALRFSPAGQEIFNFWRHDLEIRLRGDHGLPPSMESHIAKYRSLMPSLALIFHLVEVADGSATPGPISEKAALMASAWCDYLESHAGRVYGGATMPGMEAAREVIKHIHRGVIQSGCKPKDIYRNNWSRLTTPEEVKTGLEVLEEYEWLIVEKVTTGGRPSEIITLNPHIKL